MALPLHIYSATRSVSLPTTSYLLSTALLARPVRFERTTYGSGGHRSIQAKLRAHLDSSIIRPPRSVNIFCRKKGRGRGVEALVSAPSTLLRSPECPEGHFRRGSERWNFGLRSTFASRFPGLLSALRLSHVLFALLTRLPLAQRHVLESAMVRSLLAGMNVRLKEATTSAYPRHSVSPPSHRFRTS